MADRSSGPQVTIETVAPGQRELDEIDWFRSLHPAMGGPLVRLVSTGAHLVREVTSGRLVGVLDAAPVPGYPDVASVSIYSDPARAQAGWALEAYGTFVLSLFEQGIRLVHHEVLEFNRPIQRILRGLGVQPSARLRSHAFVAGRFWDVLVFSYDRAHLDHIVERVVPQVGRYLADGAQATNSTTQPEVPATVPRRPTSGTD